MFQQEINLYNSFKEPEPPFSILNWRTFMLSNMLILIILSLIAIYDFINIHQLGNKKAALEANVASLQKKFQETKKQFPPEFFQKDADKSIEKLTSTMQARRHLLQQLSNKSSFSKDLEALSTIIIPDVWLTTISITKGGDTLALHGKSRTADQLQTFLTKLTEYPLFKDYALSVKNIEDDTESDAKGDLVFEITLVKKT